MIGNNVPNTKYFSPQGGLPKQTERVSGQAVFNTAYAVIPKSVMSDIVTSYLPHWNNTRAWILARPLSGFAETFSQYAVEVAPNGGSDNPEPEVGAEAVLFITDGKLKLKLGGEKHDLIAGSYVYIPAGETWSLHNVSDASASFQWVRKQYEPIEGYDKPEAIITHDDNVPMNAMPDTDGRWGTTRFVEPDDLRHDMHVNIVTFEPGGVIPFAETHVMEHGIYILEGKAVYRLNEDWYEVEAGDYLWLRAFCPQACYAGGSEKFRYLLYKDVNRHPKLSLK